MTEDEIRNKIFDIVAKEARLDRASLTPETRLEDLKIESLDMVQILFLIEDEFDISIPTDDQAFKGATLKTVVEGAQKLISAKRQPA